jgi:hypothetical protein
MIKTKKKPESNIVKNVYDLGEGFELTAPKTKEHLHVYCACVLNSRFPYPSSDNEHCLTNGHLSPLDALWSAYSEEDDFSIWYAMRGSGKTYNLSLLSWLESLFKRKCKTTVLGGSLEQSTKAVGYLQYLWDLFGSLASEQFVSNNLEIFKKDILVNGAVAGRGYKLTNGSEVQALSASPKSVRGPHPQKLRLDELDEMDESIYNSALGQPKANYGIKDNIVISSTLHHPFGLMTKVIDERDSIGAKLFQWCVYDVTEPFGFWSKEEVSRRQRQMPIEMWESEYLLNRPKLGGTIFDFGTIDRAYQRGIRNTFDKTILPEGGIDWGYNCTVLHVLQDIGQHFSIPESYSWEYYELTERCDEIIDICIEKRIKILYCDSNPKDANMTLKKRAKKKNYDIAIMPVVFSVWKDIGISVIRYLLQKNLIDITDKTTQDKLKKYHYSNVDQGIIAKKDDHYPDALIAWGASRWKILGNVLRDHDKLEKKDNELRELSLKQRLRNIPTQKN